MTWVTGGEGGSQHLGLMEGFPHRWDLLDWIAFDFWGATCWESGGMLQKKVWLKVHFVCHIKSTTTNLFHFFFLLVKVEPVKQQLWACYWREARITASRPPSISDVLP